MIPLVAPCVTAQDRTYACQRIAKGLLDSEAEVRRFEEAFAAYVGCEWAVAVNSGTSALTLALHVSPGYGSLSLPSYCCTAVRNAAGLQRFGVEYVDSTWDVRTARMTCSDADVLVHMFGTPTSMATHPFVEDYTLSLGGVSYGGGLGVCSTHASKMVSTGRGGVIFGDDDELRAQIRDFADCDTHDGFGYSVAMSAMQGALGVSQLQQLDKFIARRRELAHRYTEAFRPAGIDCPDSDCGSVFFRYLIAVDDPAAKVEALAEHGIEAGRGVYPPLHRLAGLPDDDFPGTTAAVESLLSVPVHPSITDEQARHIIESVLAVCA